MKPTATQYRKQMETIAELMKDRDELAARVEELESAIREAIRIAKDDNPYRVTGPMDIYEILNEVMVNDEI